MDLGVGVGERIGDGEDQQRRGLENALANARMAVPGIILDFNTEKQTATVQPTIKERINGSWEQLPQLLDVPVFFPRAGGYCLTFPVKQGDECLIIFADMCIDSWWQSGDVQTQLEMRRHDLSDAMALLGITSVPRAVKNYSADTVQYRNEAGDTYVEISEDVINIKASKLNIDVRELITVTSPNTEVTTILDVTGDTSITGDLKVTGDTSITGDSKVLGDVTANESIIQGVKFTEHKNAGLPVDM